MKTTMTILALAAVIMLLGGCNLHTMDLPANFVAVGKYDMNDYIVRGVSSDGVAIGLRTQDNPKNGTLEFWSQAVRNELTTSKGYKLTNDEPLTNSAGTAGKLLTFTSMRSGVEFTYLTAIFVKSDQILLAEAGGKTEAIKPKLDDIRKTMRSAR